MQSKQDWQHDIDLPQYGPYDKCYVGFSHIADPKRGLRLDIDVLPGKYRHTVMDTRSTIESGAKMWQARTDLKRFIYRFEMNTPKVWIDTDFSQDGTEAMICCTFANDTDSMQSLTADFCLSLRKPSFYGRSVSASDVTVPDGVIWRSASEYAMQEGITEISHDGFRVGEAPEQGAVGTCAMPFTAGKPVTLGYTFDTVCADGILFRYRSGRDAQILVNGESVLLPASDTLATACFPMKENEYSSLTLQIDADLILDGFALGRNPAGTVFTPWPEVFVPEVTHGKKSISLAYPLLTKPYNITWDAEDLTVRELIGESDGEILIDSVQRYNVNTLRGRGKGYYTDLLVSPVFLRPGEHRTVNLRISFGSEPREVEKLPCFAFDCNPCGEKLLPAVARLMPATALNVVYPTHYRGSYIRNYTPGREWDSYYTWDCGMIAVGLTAIDRARAKDSVHAYLMPQEDPLSPYLNHGTPLLTQMFAYKELLDLGEKDACREMYPALRYAFRFFLKQPRHGGPISTWHIFYNSGGWDDYPTQRYVHEHMLQKNTAALTVTSMMLQYTKILKNAARQLGFAEDISSYEEAEKELRTALAPCWDEEAGYFGYATCDADGNFTGILRDENGVNPNQGLDGIYPMFGGVGTAAQKRRMMRNLREGLLTPCGVSVIDTRSPYYITNGYWNGTVWVPHQWILWKCLLDQGEAKLAHKIAAIALKKWAEETARSNCTYEYFIQASGQGAGFYHFSGLSSPVLTWFKAYYVPGSATVGFDSAITEQVWNDDRTALTLTLETHRPKSVLLLTMRQGEEYTFDGLPEGAVVTKLHPGTYSLAWKQTGTFTLTVRKAR